MIDVFLRHTFPAKQGGFSLDVRFNAPGHRLAFYGPSGSGKTLTLQTIAGLFTPREGHVHLNNRTLLDTAGRINIPARRRNLGYLFQDYALFPHLSVWENIAFSFGSLISPRKRSAAHARVAEMVENFELSGLENQRPGMISGGQRQRVALARALASKPDLLMLDEPFSALDPQLRNRVRTQCREWLDQFNIPAIIITHDPLDVTALADTVIPYRNGRNSGSIPVADFQPGNMDVEVDSSSPT